MAAITLPVLPPTEVLLFCGGAAVTLFFLLAACFGPFVSSIYDLRAISSGRGFYAKAARQIAQMNALLCVLALFFFAVCAWHIAPLWQEWLLPPYKTPFIITLACIAGGIVCTLLHAMLLSAKKTSNYAFPCLGFLAGGLSAAAVLACTGFLRRALHTPFEQSDATMDSVSQIIAFFDIPYDSFFWPLLAEAVPLGLTACAACATLWLLLMRDRQDYGRDYYAFALPSCARWAFAAALVTVPLGAYVFFAGQKIMLPELSHLPSFLLEILAVALPLIACGLWFSISRSAVPMRRKISVILAFLFFVGGFAAQVLILNKIIPSP